MKCTKNYILGDNDSTTCQSDLYPRRHKPHRSPLVPGISSTTPIGDTFPPSSHQRALDLHSGLTPAQRREVRANTQKKIQYKLHLTCTHVFMRRDQVRAPLEPPYIGFYKIIHRITHRFFIGGMVEISVHNPGRSINFSS